jgi:ElaB/YqjD/DUF883 family membrane-anchored ribosome-binding protein
MDRKGVEDSASNVAERGKEAVGAFADDTKSRAEGVVRQAQDTYGHVRDHARDAAEVITDSVQQQPLLAVLAAGTLGCLLGLLLARR